MVLMLIFEMQPPLGLKYVKAHDLFLLLGSLGCLCHQHGVVEEHLEPQAEQEDLFHAQAVVVEEDLPHALRGEVVEVDLPHALREEVVEAEHCRVLPAVVVEVELCYICQALQGVVEEAEHCHILPAVVLEAEHCHILPTVVVEVELHHIPHALREVAEAATAATEHCHVLQVVVAELPYALLERVEVGASHALQEMVVAAVPHEF